MDAERIPSEPEVVYDMVADAEVIAEEDRDRRDIEVIDQRVTVIDMESGARVATHGPILSPRQQAFIREFLSDSNAANAAIRAGYSPRVSTEIGRRLLEHPVVGTALRRATEHQLARLGMSRERILSEMTMLAFTSLEHFAIDDFGNVTVSPYAPEGAMRGVQSIRKKIRHAKDGSITYETEVRLWPKVEPLRLIGKQVGLFADRVEHTGKDGKPIEIERIERVIIDPKPIDE